MSLPYAVNFMTLGYEVVRIRDNRYIGMVRETAAGWQPYDNVHDILLPMAATKEEAAEVVWRSHKQRGGDE